MDDTMLGVIPPSNSNRPTSHLLTNSTTVGNTSLVTARHPFRRSTSIGSKLRYKDQQQQHSRRAARRHSNKNTTTNTTTHITTTTTTKPNNNRILHTKQPTIESGQYEDLLEFFAIETTSDNDGDNDEDYSPANIYGFESFIIDALDGELDDAFDELGF